MISFLTINVIRLRPFPILLLSFFSVVKADFASYLPPPYYLFNIKYISVHILLLMNVVLVFIFMDFPDLCGTGSKRKIQNENNVSSGNTTSDPSLSNVSP